MLNRLGLIWVFESKIFRISIGKFLSQFLPIFVAALAFQSGDSEVITRLIVLVPIVATFMRVGIDDFLVIERQRQVDDSPTHLRNCLSSSVSRMLPAIPLGCGMTVLTFSEGEIPAAFTCLILQLATMAVSTHFLIRNQLFRSILTRPLGIGIGCTWILLDLPLAPIELLIAILLAHWSFLAFNQWQSRRNPTQPKFDSSFFAFLLTEALVWNLLPLVDIILSQDGFESLILQRLIAIVSTTLIILFYGYLRDVSTFYPKYRSLALIFLILFYVGSEYLVQTDFNLALPFILFYVVLAKYYFSYLKRYVSVMVLNAFIICLFGSLWSLRGVLSPLEHFVIAHFVGYLIFFFLKPVSKIKSVVKIC